MTTLREVKDQAVYSAVVSALRTTRGDVPRAAELLEISTRQLWRHMKHFRLHSKNFMT